MSAVAADGWSPSQLGTAIRALRVSRGMSVSELARRSGLSQSFLSQVEIGRSDISVGRLVRLAEVLEVGLADLVDQPRGPADQVARADERVPIPTSSDGLRLFLLARSFESSRTNGLGYLEPGTVGAALPTRPGTESFVYVLEGAVQLGLSGGRVLTLNSGDSACCRAAEFHGMTNPGEAQCAFLWIQAAARVGLPYSP